MWWLHTVEIHLAISAFSAGAAFGIAFAAFVIWRNK
jgi:hypothetical protein